MVESKCSEERKNMGNYGHTRTGTKNNIKKMIDKEKINRMCRMCGKRGGDGSFKSECKKLAQKEYTHHTVHHRVVLITLGAMQKNWRSDGEML